MRFEVQAVRCMAACSTSPLFYMAQLILLQMQLAFPRKHKSFVLFFILFVWKRLMFPYYQKTSFFFHGPLLIRFCNLPWRPENKREQVWPKKHMFKIQ